MTLRPAALLAAVVLAGPAAGCAAKHPDAGFGDVQDAIRQRSGFEAYWEQQTHEGPSVEERVRALLEGELTERGAIEIALLNNRRLQSTFEELGIARADLLEARLVRNPVLSAEVRFPDRPIEISITQSVLDLITLHRRKGVAEAAFEATKQRVGDEVLRTINEVRIGFYTQQAAEQMRSMRETVVEAARAGAELAIRQHEAGNISDLDLENEQSMLAQAKLDLATSDGDVLVQKERLNRLMGVWGAQTSWKVAPTLPEIPAEEADLTQVESLAISQRLDLLAARHQVESAARAVGLGRPEALGEIFAGIHREREPEGIMSTGPAVGIPLPLFNRGRARKMRAESVFRQTLDRYAALAVEIRAEVGAARGRLELARTKAAYYRDVVLPRRRRIVDFSQQHYNFMLKDAFQLLIARQNEIASRREYIEALRDYWIARSELERAVGGAITSEKRAPGSAPPGEGSGGRGQEGGKPSQQGGRLQ